MRVASNIEGQLRALMATRLGTNEADIIRDASLVTDLGADSLDVVSLIMEIEDEFDIEIPDEDAAQLLTVKHLLDYVEFATAAKDTGQSRQLLPSARGDRDH